MQSSEEWGPSTQIIIQASKSWNDPFDLEDSFPQNGKSPILTIVESKVILFDLLPTKFNLTFPVS